MKISKHLAKWQSAFLAMASVALLSSPLMASDALEEVELTEKLIQVGPAVNDTDPLYVTLDTEKNTYRPNETIRFKVKGNKPFYLLLFNIDPSSGKGIAILPNRYQGKGSLKYPAGATYAVPNKNLRFYSDRPGTERIIMIASTRFIDPDKLLKKTRSKALGDSGMYMMDSLLDGLESTLSESYQKAIQVRSSKARLPKGMVVREVNLRVR